MPMDSLRTTEELAEAVLVTAQTVENDIISRLLVSNRAYIEKLLDS